MIAFIYLFSLLFAGSQAPPTPRTPKPPVNSDRRTDLQRHIDMLNREARNKHLRWRVFCVDSTMWKFQGWAVQPGDDFGIYAEEGAKDSWNSIGMTQDEALRSLYLSIQGAPNAHPLHSTSRSLKICAPELTGG